MDLTHTQSSKESMERLISRTNSLTNSTVFDSKPFVSVSRTQTMDYKREKYINALRIKHQNYLNRMENYKNQNR